ncbi:hypothetical protein V8G54_037989 (chloroplast) [Vigna mungo]|uniref:Uncharacterized protein n=1 Tax=Vigna mungo TaxID=3915 RepID=A0AAQ3RDK9_VIGMU
MSSLGTSKDILEIAKFGVYVTANHSHVHFCQQFQQTPQVHGKCSQLIASDWEIEDFLLLLGDQIVNRHSRVPSPSEVAQLVIVKMGHPKITSHFIDDQDEIETGGAHETTGRNVVVCGHRSLHVVAVWNLLPQCPLCLSLEDVHQI